MSYAGTIERGRRIETPWPECGGSSRDSSWSLVGEVESQLPVRPVSAKEWQAQSQVPELDIPSDLRLALLQSQHLTDLQRFDFPELKFLTDNLERENWLGCPRARLARAVRAGLSAREKLEGRLTATVASPSLPSGGRSLWYVCLRSPRFPTGFLTQNYRCYISEVQDQHRKFHPTGVSHSFPSLEEVLAYLAGSQAPWPPALQQ